MSELKGRAVSNTAAEVDPALMDLVRSLMDEHSIPGLAIGLVTPDQDLTSGFGVTSVENPLPVDANTIFVAASITKTVVATAVMVLVNHRKLDLEVPIRTYLPDLRLADEDVAAKVTLRHLMTHTAGWVGDEFEETDFGMGDDALARAVAVFNNRSQITPLGSVWSYNNSGFWLAGRVIEIVTEKSLEAAVTELVFSPLEMASSFFFEADAITRRCAVGHQIGDAGELTVVRPWSTTRAAHSAGGMLTTIADLTTFARFHLGDGEVSVSSGVLGSEALHTMHEPVVRAEGSEWAGIGWVVRDVAGQRVLSHGGDWNGQQSLLTLIPSQGVAIATLANSGMGRLANNAIASWALHRYLGATDPEPVPVDQDDERLDALEGRYVLPVAVIEIARRGTRLGVTYLPAALPGVSNPAVPELPAALTTDGRIVVLGGPFKGVTGDFILGPRQSVDWIRLGGRVYPREAASTPV